MSKTDHITRQDLEGSLAKHATKQDLDRVSVKIVDQVVEKVVDQVVGQVVDQVAEKVIGDLSQQISDLADLVDRRCNRIEAAVRVHDLRLDNHTVRIEKLEVA